MRCKADGPACADAARLLLLSVQVNHILSCGMLHSPARRSLLILLMLITVLMQGWLAAHGGPSPAEVLIIILDFQHLYPLCHFIRLRLPCTTIPWITAVMSQVVLAL